MELNGIHVFHGLLRGITRRSYLRRKPPLLKGAAVVHLDSPEELPVAEAALPVGPKQLQSWPGPG